MKSLFKFFALFAFAGVISAAPAPENAPKAVTYPHRRPRIELPHHPNFRHGQSQKPGSSNGFWRVFSQLTPAEQKEMMQLQRSEPEKFRTVMQEKLEKIQAEQREKHRKVNELAEKIRNSKDDKEKTALRAELRTMLKSSFDARLAQMRRNIEANKKRIERMEAELKKREVNTDAIVDAITESVITGKRPERGPARSRER
ncbi:MAG: hypothetical protein J6R86_08460 [Lentisphaeria bacterium]|nr:hypothetical protein [Lentisphaeria bacterium]